MYINTTIQYGSPVRELLTCKLSCFYNKEILEHPIRVIFVLPQEEEIHTADRYKSLFDEIVTVRVDVSNAQFWNTRALSKFYYFASSIIDIYEEHIFIDSSKVIKQIPMISESSQMVCAERYDDPSLMSYVNSKMEACGFTSLDTSTLEYYDFSIMSMSEEVRSRILQPLKKILKLYPEFIDDKCAYAIISWLTRFLGVPVRSLGVSPKDISRSPLLDDFYCLI